MSTIVVCTALLASLAGAQTQEQDAAALRDYFSANGLLNRGLYEMAVTEYRAFLEHHPDHEKAPTARYGLAVALLRLNQHADAATEARPLAQLTVFEYRAEALMVLGQSELALGRHAEAADAFGRVVRDFPAHDMADEAAALEAESLYESGKFDGVDRACGVLAERWPDSPYRARAEFFRGLALAARGDDAAAAAAFEPLATAHEGDLADRAALLLARSLHRAGELEKSEQAYRRVITQNRPDLAPEGTYGLAVLLQATGRGTEAGALLDGLLAEQAQGASAPAARLLRGRLFLADRHYDEALNQFRQLAGHEDLDDDAAYWSARCALERGNNQEAEQALKAALDQFPKSDLVPAMTVDRAAALLGNGDADQAAALLQGFMQRDGKHELTPEALDLLASAERQRGQIRESLTLCTTFAQQYPDHARAAAVELMAAGNLYTLKEYDKAAAAYQAIVEKRPQSEQALSARCGLGLALHQLQRYEDAETWLRPLAKGSQTPGPDRPALLALGDGRFQRGDWEGALADLDVYVAFGLDQPGADDALLKLGLSRQRLKHPQPAREAFDTLLERFPQSPHRAAALLGRGEVLLDMERPEEAAASLQLAVAEQPGSSFAAAAQERLAEMALARGQPLEAAELFGGAASAWGDQPQADNARLRRASALMSAQRFREALDILAALAAHKAPKDRLSETAALRAIAMARLATGDELAAALREIESVEKQFASALEPQTLQSLGYERAWCLRSMGRNEDAAAAYRKVLDATESVASGPPSLVAQHATVELAELESSAGHNQEAAALLKSILERDPAPAVRSQAEYRLGAVELALGDHERAATLLEKYLGGEPDTALLPSALLLCAESQARSGSWRRAAELLERLIRDYPSDEATGAALLKLGECRASLREWQESEAAFEDHRQRFPESDVWFQAAFGAGRAREAQGQHEQAIAVYRQITSRHDGPTAARAQFQIGECLFAMGRREEAARELLKVDILYAFPEWSAAALYEAGRCFEESGSPVEARKQYEQVARQHPETSWAKLAEERLSQLARNPLPGRDAPERK